MSSLLRPPPWTALLRRAGLPSHWKQQLDELSLLVRTVTAAEPPAPPAPVMPAGVERLDTQLARAGLESPSNAEALARGALRGGHGQEELLAWALELCDDPTHGETGAAVACAVIRDRGYRPLLALADREPGLPPVFTMPAGPGLNPSLFAVPRAPFLLAAGTRRRFAHDYPYLRPALAPRPPFDHASLFRPEAIPALAQEQEFLALVGQATDDEFENSILPISRVPGLNVLVLAALLLQELLDPMEVLDWVGADINALPRTPMPNRPEDIVKLSAPGDVVNGRPTKYMIFADVHRDAPQDLAFRVGHFSDNKELFLTALEWCDDHGHTVLELGDCEEMWYVPTFDPAQRQSKLDRLKAIVQLHSAVYDKLDDLADDGRYHRCIGNHDSYEWEVPAVAAWRLANDFPEIHGGFIIPHCKTMDDFLPHIGLDPDSYDRQADMLLLHGHQFDFWNCDEHNRLGKFITNAIGVPPDALAHAIYDFRGLDRFGHPLVEFWDVLAPLDPFNNWPPEQVARQWATELENRPVAANLTKDSIIFPESLVALFAYLMRSGPPSLLNFSVMLCLGHTHNPVCRPWIPFFERFNPWRDEELFGIPLFQNLFALKSRYMSVGPTGWWQHIVWAIEITEEGQPRMLYWSKGCGEPQVMDWELADEATGLPANPLAGLLAWARQYLRDDVLVGLEAALDALTSGAPAPAPVAPGGNGGAAVEVPPDLSTLRGLLAGTARSRRPARPALPLTSLAAMEAVDRTGPVSQLATAGLLLAARHDPAFGGASPPGRPADRTAPPPPMPTAVVDDLWPRLLTGCAPADRIPRIGIGALARGLNLPFPGSWRSSRPPPRPAGPRGTDRRPTSSGLRVRVPGQDAGAAARTSGE
jgi:hypothetical protein